LDTFAAIFVPDFALQAVLRQEAESCSKSIALVDPSLPKPNIIQLTSPARAQGVIEGLTASQAMARSAELRILSRSLAQEQAAMDILLQTAYAFSPSIENSAPGVCTLELKGLGLDGESALQDWAAQIVAALETLSLRVRIGVASTPSLALLAAKAARPTLIVRDVDAFVSALPVDVLEPSPSILDILERWGVQTIGELLNLGRTELADRLGPEIVSLLRRLSPHASRPLKLVAPRQTFAEQVEFEVEIETAEPLLFVLRRFVEQLARRLDVIHLVVAQLHLQLKLGSGAVYEHHFRIPAPTADVNTLFRTLQTHLESVRTETAIVGLTLEATPCLPQTHQFGLFETTLRDPNQFAETLACLTALCGSDRVGTPVVASTHRPDVFSLRSPQFDAQASGAAHVDAAIGLALRRFRPAIPATVEFRGERPALLRSSSVNGAVVEVRGPYRSSGDWWDRQVWTREEWDVQTADGTLCRIFRTGTECFVEGVYD